MNKVSTSFCLRMSCYDYHCYVLHHINKSNFEEPKFDTKCKLLFVVPSLFKYINILYILIFIYIYTYIYTYI